jgi:ribosomal protein S6--L-glutamate ligase
LAIADVDIMFLNKRLLLLEVNSYPGIEGIEKATSKDITNKFIIAIEKKLKFKSL